MSKQVEARTTFSLLISRGVRIFWKEIYWLDPVVADFLYRSVLLIFPTWRQNALMPCPTYLTWRSFKQVSMAIEAFRFSAFRTSRYFDCKFSAAFVAWSATKIFVFDHNHHGLSPLKVTGYTCSVKRHYQWILAPAVGTVLKAMSDPLSPHSRIDVSSFWDMVLQY